MLDFYFPDHFDWAKIPEIISPIPGAKVQDVILTHNNDPDAALRTLLETRKETDGT